MMSPQDFIEYHQVGILLTVIISVAVGWWLADNFPE